jgi:tetratricopeptide (TPR) repeat protein
MKTIALLCCAWLPLAAMACCAALAALPWQVNGPELAGVPEGLDHLQAGQPALGATGPGAVAHSPATRATSGGSLPAVVVAGSPLRMGTVEQGVAPRADRAESSVQGPVLAPPHEGHQGIAHVPGGAAPEQRAWPAVRPLPPLPAAAATGHNEVPSSAPLAGEALQAVGAKATAPGGVARGAVPGSETVDGAGRVGETLPPQVLRMVEELLRRAESLAQRRALYSARLELLRALEVLAAANDAQHQTQRHTEALAEALRALDEAGDFVPRRGGLMAQVDVATVAAGHRCRAREGTNGAMSAPAALRRYYDYAQAQLVRAAAGTRHASITLSMLGKLYLELAREPLPALPDPVGWALVWQQAAVEVDGNNWVAANELGVLLARLGRYEEAVAWLQRSVALAPQAENWRNLAIVHHYLGQDAQALEAHRRALALARTASAASPTQPAVQWVSPGAFRQSPAAGMR